MLNRESIAVILASNNIKRFKSWLSNSWCHLKGTRLMLVPFGPDSDDIITNAPMEANICIPAEDTTLEGNRNSALKHLRESKHPEFVAFLDDDTFVDTGWIEALLKASISNPSAAAFSSIVRSFGTDEYQSCGHIFRRSSPYDLCFKHISNINPICPCGNCAFILWSAFQKIWEVDANCWDPRFQQWQTCFDFGLKLILTGTNTVLVKNATAQHQGYMTWNDTDKEKKKDTVPLAQLRSRYLLYRKFLPEFLLEKVKMQMSKLEKKWSKNGYPGFKNQLIGPEMSIVMEKSQILAKELWIANPNEVWKNLMTKTSKCTFDLGI
jgi:hypothetical protein